MGALMTQGKLNWIVLSMAAVGLGFAMPSCPGQDALQQQVNTLQSANQELTKKVQALTSQITTLTNENNEFKKFVKGATDFIGAQDAFNAKIMSSMQSSQKKGGKRR
jgi:hypothetical protein